MIIRPLMPTNLIQWFSGVELNIYFIALENFSILYVKRENTLVKILQVGYNLYSLIRYHFEKFLLLRQVNGFCRN
jgi:hypothetical protein